MILLLGGTSETAPMAEALAKAGFRVLVSTATGIPLAVGNHPHITHRQGRLSEQAMAALVREQGIQAIVDVTHPYAGEVRAIAPRVAVQLGIEYLTFIRPGIGPMEEVTCASTHPDAAALACSIGKPVLLTTGSKNLEPYVREARRTGTVLAVRVLPHADSIELCRRAGIPDARIVAARGPFSVEDTRQLIRRLGIGVLVTKDSGAAGGLREKLAAARMESCRVVMMSRPAISRPTPEMPQPFDDVHSLVQELARRVISGIEREPHDDKGFGSE